MNSVEKSRILFLLGCFPVRLLLAYLATKPNFLFPIGIFAAIISVGFFVIFFTGIRKTGAETFGRPIWWNNLRPVHGTMYAFIAYFALTKNKTVTPLLLLLDAFIGLMAFTRHLIRRL